MTEHRQWRAKDKQCRDKHGAKRWITRINAEAHGAMFAQPTNTGRPRPLKEVVEIWKETCWTGLSPTTTARYGQVQRTYLEPEFGTTPSRS